jgi:RNA polymerase sigma-70 factor (ECF subfamily)
MNQQFLDQILVFEKDLKGRALYLYKGNPASVDDLVQDTILKALDKEHQYEPGTNLSAWLRTILFHLFVNGHRRKKRFNEIVDENRDTVRRFTNTSGLAEPNLHTLEMNSLQDLLQDELDDIFYEVLVYVDIEGRTYKDTASYLGLPVGTVMSRLHRARLKSRQILLDKYDPILLETYLSPETLGLSNHQ